MQTWFYVCGLNLALLIQQLFDLSVQWLLFLYPYEQLACSVLYPLLKR